MIHHPAPTPAGDSWQRAFEAFLAEKLRRSGSRRTVETYAGLLRQCFGTLGKTPEQVRSQDVFTWAYANGPSGRVPSASTVAARIAGISSFYHFLIRMGLLQANPCDALERPRPTPGRPRGLTAAEVTRLLHALPDSPAGLRDSAIILTLVLTGRRRAEVLGLKAGDVSWDGDHVFYHYHGKGGKEGQRELPPPAWEAIQRALLAWGRTWERMAPGDSLWPGHGTPGISSGTFYARLQRYFAGAGLPPAGVHIFRHTAAKLRRKAGASLEDVSHFLDHSSLAVTSVYLQRLESPHDTGWGSVAQAIGL